MKRLPKTFWRLLATPALALALLACASGPPGYEETSQSWQEEVQLQDGRVIVVVRTDYYSPYCGPGIRCGLGKRGGNTRSKLEFERDGRRIVWERAMRPIILQTDRDSSVVVARFATRDQLDRYVVKEGRNPGSEYLAFRYANGTWQRISLNDADVPPETNLLISSSDAGFWVSLKEKKQLNGRIRISNSWRKVPLN